MAATSATTTRRKRPPLHLDGPGPLGQQAEELAVEVAALGSQRPAQLRRQGQPAGGGERLGDLLDA